MIKINLNVTHIELFLRKFPQDILERKMEVLLSKTIMHDR